MSRQTIDPEAFIQDLRAQLAPGARELFDELICVWTVHHFPKILRAFGVDAPSPRTIDIRDGALLRSMEREFDRAGLGVRAARAKRRASSTDQARRHE